MIIMSHSYSNFGHGGRENHQKGYDYDRRYARGDRQVEGRIIELLTRFREYKPYLQKRLRHIQESGQTKLLRDDVKDIQRWLDIATDGRNDVVFGVSDLEDALTKMLDMVRLYPMQETAARVEFSDEEEDNAPRSPSPGPLEENLSSSTRIIPLESAREDRGWSADRDVRSNSHSGASNRIQDSYHERNMGGSQRTDSLFGRGDTDMRFSTRYDAFQQPDINRLGGSNRGDHQRFQETDYKSKSSSRSDGSNTMWDRYRPQGDRSDDRSRNGGPYSESRHGRQNPNQESNRNSDNTNDRSRVYLKDQDYRSQSRTPEVSKSGARGTSDKDRYYNEKHWMRIKDRRSEGQQSGRQRNYSGDHRNSFGESETRASSNNRRDQDHFRRDQDYSRRDNDREKWNHSASKVSSARADISNSPVYGTSSPSMNSSAGYQNQNPFILNPFSATDNSRAIPPLLSPPANCGPALRPPSRLGYDSATSPAQSPMSPTSPFNNRPGLLPTPPGFPPINANQFHANFSNPAMNNRPPPSVNPFDPRIKQEISMEELKAKAQQHFSARHARPKCPRPDASTTSASNALPQPAGPNLLSNPIIATNQIAAALPTDPRRLSQLQRMQKLQQQQATKSVAAEDSDSLPDPRQIKSSNTESKEIKSLNEKTSNNSAESEASSSRGVSPDADCKKNSKAQEIRRSLESQTIHRLGSKVSPDKGNDEHASGDFEHDDEPDNVKEICSKDNRSESPERKKMKKEPNVAVKKSPRGLSRQVSASNADTKSKCSSSTPTHEKELRSRAPPKTCTSATMAPSALQNSVSSFRIPKIKKPDPPPKEMSPVRSPSPKEQESVTMEQEDNSVHPVQRNISPQPDTSRVTDQCSSTEVNKGASEPDGPTKNNSQTSSDTDILLRQLLLNTFPETVVGDILDNSDALEKIKRLLTDQIPALVNLKNTKTPDGSTIEEEEESHEQSSNSGPASDTEPSCSRGRSLVRKRGNKRRSSLERLHDALKEMNFDAVLPLGPRRHSRGHDCTSEEQGAGNTCKTEGVCLKADSAVTSSINERVSDSVGYTKEQPQASVPKPRVANKSKVGKGKKRKRRVAAKKGKKKSVIKPIVTAEAAELAASAIIVSGSEESVVLTQTNGQTGSEVISSDLVSSGIQDKKISTEPTRKNLRSKQIRSSPENQSEARLTRSRAKPLGADTKAAETPQPSEKSETEPLDESNGKEESELPIVHSTEKVYSIHTENLGTQITAVCELSNNENGVQTSESSDVSTQVFRCGNYSSDSTINCIKRHEKLLENMDRMLVSVSISKSSPLSEYLKSSELEHKRSKELEESLCRTYTSAEIPSECTEAMEWMTSVLEHQSHRICANNCVENADDSSSLDLSDLIFDMNSEASNKLIKIENCDLDESDDDGELRFEELFGSRGTDDSPRPVRLDDCDTPIKVDVDTDYLDATSLSPTIGGDSQEGAYFSAKMISEGYGDSSLPDAYEETSMDTVSFEDENDANRKMNLEGHDLYRCANENCKFTASSGSSFKEHAIACSSDAKMFQCFHCERRLKSLFSFMEHMKIHGKPRQLCSMCDFSGWFTSELSKHMKNAHKIYNLKTLTEVREHEDPVQVTYAKEVAQRLATPNELTQNHVLYTSRVQFRPTEIDSIPRTCVFTALIHCAMCDYATKVRSNMIRHLMLHTNADCDGGVTEVPDRAPVNPVPCLERKEMMFDKMTNWAGSSHEAKVGGVSKEDTLKLPKFVPDQLRYKCSVSSCYQITGQDEILLSHMKTLHSKEKLYKCPHCQEEDGTKNDPRNAVPLEKISHHLKLHGPKLSKCGHCDYINYAPLSMEKHIATKHVEKKPIFYLIRNLDSEGNSITRRPSTDDPSKISSERWRCTLCKNYAGNWNEAKDHCRSAHKVGYQFSCSICHYSSDSIYAISNHILNKTCRGDTIPAKVLIMFYRCEATEGVESKMDESGNLPLWRRDVPRIKHIRGIFLDEENHKKPPSNPVAPVSAKAPPKLTTAVTAAVTKPTSVHAQLLCPKCNVYLAKNPSDLKVHLFEEMEYLRYQCKLCLNKSVSMNSHKVHVINEHKVAVDETNLLVLPEIVETETEVYDIVSSLVSSQRLTDEKDGRNTESLLCKHCYAHITSYHNYRTHVLAKHIGSERFRCGYCNVGFWNEGLLKIHHSKSSHSDLPIAVVKDDEFECKLTPEFWFKEYNIPLNKSGNPGSASPQKASRSNSSTSANESELSVNVDTVTKAKVKPAISQDAEKASQKRLEIIQNVMKNFKELASVYRCEFCTATNFTQRGMRSHWQKEHLMHEHQCRYTKCKSYDELLNLTDGFAIKCSLCPYQSVSIEHFHNHQDREHPGQPFRYKRKKRVDFKNKILAVKLFICNLCHSECDSETAMKAHNSRSHQSTPVNCRIEELLPNSPASASEVACTIVESVATECPICSSEFNTLTNYIEHFNQSHNQDYMEPHLKFVRVSSAAESISECVTPLPQLNQRPAKNPEVRRYPPFARKQQDTSLQQQNYTANGDSRELVLQNETPGPSNNENIPAQLIGVTEQRFMYECPQCDFRSEDGDYVRNQHLISHLLAYCCPECNLAFQSTIDAQFHIRHFHGISKVRPIHNKNTYIEFSALKERVIKVPISTRNVVCVNLEDEDDFASAVAASPIPSVEELTASLELDIGMFNLRNFPE